MPRIPDQNLDAAVYLYRTPEAAEAGEDAGGTGFILSNQYPDVPDRAAACVVTNKHVIMSGATVVRVNRRDGSKPDIFSLEPHDWFPHRGPHDLTMTFGILNEGDHRITHVRTDQLVTRDIWKTYNIGAGDDTFMIGRFIGHDGKLHNRPSVRFGNISMNVGPIRHPTLGWDEESFAVEMKSKPGYSGAPVTVYGTSFLRVLEDGRAHEHQNFCFVLGVDWGQIQEKRPVIRNGKETPGEYVAENSGMNGVVPAWHILDMFQQPEIAQIMNERNEQAKRKYGQSRTQVSPSVASSAPAPQSALPATDENPTHLEDFGCLVDLASKKKEPGR